jgi:hypothetical protein
MKRVLGPAGAAVPKVIAIASIVNSPYPRGDAAAFIALAIQVPWRATVSIMGYDIWFQ